MTIYLDASVLVSIVVDEANTARAEQFLRNTEPVMTVSDFAAAEVSSAIASRVRMGILEIAEAREALFNFDAWLEKMAMREPSIPADIAAAQTWLRRMDLPLRTPDAINIAIARRLDCRLATFDEKMLVAARALGVSLAKL